MGSYTISTTNDNRTKTGKQALDLAHNMREKQAVDRANFFDKANGRESHIDESLSHKNAYIKTESVEEAYERIMGNAIGKFNAKQKRKDRRTSVEKEMGKIKNSDKQELCYELIAQIGDKRNHPDVEVCRAILKEFVKRWEVKYPNLKTFNVSLHFDEKGGTPHAHIDYIPVAFENKRGISVQNGLRRAFEEMGFTNSFKTVDGKEVLDREGGAKTQWIKDCNALLESICIEHGLGIEHPLRGKGRKHMDKEEYIGFQQALEAKQAEIEAKEKEIDIQDKTIAENRQTIAVQKKIIERQALENKALKREKGVLQRENVKWGQDNEVLQEELRNLRKRKEETAKNLYSTMQVA